jgi:hypothetical protein
MTQLLQPDVRQLGVDADGAPVRYLLVYETWLQGRHFVLLMREEPYDCCAAQPAPRAEGFTARGSTVWGELLGDEVQPLQPGEDEVLEELFQGRAQSYFAKLFRA